MRLNKLAPGDSFLHNGTLYIIVTNSKKSGGGNTEIEDVLTGERSLMNATTEVMKFTPSADVPPAPPQPTLNFSLPANLESEIFYDDDEEIVEGENFLDEEE